MVDTTSPECEGPLFDGWVTIAQAADISGYSPAYLRQLASRGRIDARKVGRDWLVDRQALEAHKARMETLGSEKHDPWRQDLAAEGRGRGQ